MMAITAEDMEFDDHYKDIKNSPHRVINWRGEGVGAFLLRLMFVCYNQIHPLSFGTTFFQVHEENKKAVQFFECFGFTAVPSIAHNQTDMLEFFK